MWQYGCPICGQDLFRCTKVRAATSIVLVDLNLEEIEEYEEVHSYFQYEGPFTCDQCGFEIESLEDLPPMTEGEIEALKRNYKGEKM